MKNTWTRRLLECRWASHLRTYHDPLTLGVERDEVEDQGQEDGDGGPQALLPLLLLLLQDGVFIVVVVLLDDGAVRV